jgi:alpha-L-rhamnosidase
MVKMVKIVLLIVIITYLPVVTISQVSIENLTCEFAKNPIGIEELHPRLSWMLESGEPDVVQEAYQIVVSKNDTIIWNSGKVDSDVSILIPYAGERLESRTEYYWTVKVWTSKGKQPVASKPAYWEMGLLAPSEWIGKWISAPRAYDFQKINQQRLNMDKTTCIEQTEPSPYIRKLFSLAKEIKKARLYISGLGYYEAYLNGGKVGDHVLDPAWTGYHKRIFYVTYDVTNQIKAGHNVLGVILGDGWYNQHSRDVWATDKSPWRDRPKVLAQLEIEYTDGTSHVIATDSSWKAHESPIDFSSVRQGESYDARNEILHWCSPDLDDKEWENAWEAGVPLGKLEAQTLQPIRVKEEFYPSKITNPKAGIYVLYYPQDIAGWLKIKVKEQEGAKITLKYGEELDQDGTVNQDKISCYTFHRRFQTDEYICKSGNWETWNPRFTYHGFTYVEISGLSDKPLADNFIAQSVYSDMDNCSSFSCSDKTINKIQQISLWSIKGNAHGYAEASPHREKLGWTGDAHLAAEATLYNFDSKLFYQKWIDDLGLEQRETGELPCIAPTSGWGFYWGNGPAWDNALILIPWYQYLFAGDEYILKNHYGQMKKYFDYVDKKSENNIVRFGLGDWSPPDTDNSGLYKTPAAVTSTAYFYIDAVLLSKISKILGYDEKSEWYLAKANAIKEKFNKTFFEPETSFYNSVTQTAQACALYQGLTTEKNHDVTVEKLVELVNAKNDHLSTGILGSKYIINTLCDNGHEELAYKIITQRTFPGWGYFIEKGATTLWERWSGEGESVKNLTFLTEVSAWFYKYILGVKHLESNPGFKKFEISPFFFRELNWAKGRVATMYGNIEVCWEKKEKVVLLKVIVPGNTSAKVRLPDNCVFEGTNKTEKILCSGGHSLKIVCRERRSN